MDIFWASTLIRNNCKTYIFCETILGNKIIIIWGLALRSFKIIRDSLTYHASLPCQHPPGSWWRCCWTCWRGERACGPARWRYKRRAPSCGSPVLKHQFKECYQPIVSEFFIKDHDNNLRTYVQMELYKKCYFRLIKDI